MARKRAAPDSERRRSGRIASTPKKSSYFEDPDPDEDEMPPRKKRGRPSGGGSRGAKQGSESESEAHVEVDEDEDDDDDDDDDDGGDYGGEDEDEDEDAPRKVQIIPLEKMRGTGGVEYEDHKLHRNTLLFLRDLKANNRRPWLKSHDDEYRRALKDWNSFVEAATATLLGIDETVPDLPVKDVVFRIHRDVRFSKDPTPYKPHFSAAWSRTGRKGPYACYYVHCEPGKSFVGGGLWHPEAAAVARLRRSIDAHPRRWRAALGEGEFRRVFFPHVRRGGDDGEALVKAFAARNQENALKKRPMGYEVTHPDIELLKLRNFTVGSKIDAETLTRDDAQEKLGVLLRGLHSFVTFLNSIVMPDARLGDDGSDNSESDDDGDGGHDGGEAQPEDGEEEDDEDVDEDEDEEQ
ncbi:hypothetical protein JDV02_004573 [Purpureocillium takamizusanense]|uniref:TIGR02453 family protein n=1 Tax=Purpureocillium takamizusanense TaxID=2060973 RepID=A0A9Q8QFI5_9HYPO|nr:uncharacterized protein JDV02_004573 [Purpureocillium takamizusanense]UNI18297.1 hypothetical protein JDV02_004573 [Purpureocillium takamizusanense]